MGQISLCTAYWTHIKLVQQLTETKVPLYMQRLARPPEHNRCWHNRCWQKPLLEESRSRDMRALSQHAEAKS